MGSATVILKFLLGLSVILFVLSGYYQGVLPLPPQIIEQLYQDPRQTETIHPPFQVKSAGTVYRVTPLFNYELWGLVVSSYDTTSWYECHHKLWGDILNIKDVCVVWGKNITSGAYRTAEFKSGSFTCYSRNPQRCSRGGCPLIEGEYLSNNHLLVGNRQVQRTIRSIRRGDQIMLKGYLAEYSRGEGEFKRGTSARRDDDGNGACETIYLTEARILKRANVLWRLLHTFSGALVVVVLIGLIINYFRRPLRFA